MTKRAINSQKVFELIERKLGSGKSRSEILEELNAVYHDRGTLARYIASVPAEKLKKRFGMLNKWLLVLLAVNIANKVTLVMLNSLPPGGLSLTVLWIALNIWLSLHIVKFRGFIYKVTGALCVIELLNRISDYFTTAGTAQYVISSNLFVLSVCIVVSLFIGSKVFPFFGILNVKKDADGHYAW